MAILRVSTKGRWAFRSITKRLALVLLSLVFIYGFCGFAILYWFVDIDVISINEDLKRKEEVSQTSQVRSFARIVHFSRSVALKADFEPCGSVCSDSEIAEWPQDPIRLVNYIESYYTQNSGRALRDPYFNFAILIYYNMAELFPPKLMKLFDEVDPDKTNVVLRRPDLAFKILWALPGFLLAIKKNNQYIAERGYFIHEYQKIFYQCKKGVIKPQVAIGVCRQNYEHWRKEK